MERRKVTVGSYHNAFGMFVIVSEVCGCTTDHNFAFLWIKIRPSDEQNCCKFFTGTIFCIQICSIVTQALSPSWYPSLYPSSYSSYIKSTSLTSQYINIREFQNLQKLVTSKTGHNFCLIFSCFHAIPISCILFTLSFYLSFLQDGNNSLLT